MAINAVQYKGDDPEWARAVENQINTDKKTIIVLQKQIKELTKKVNK